MPDAFELFIFDQYENHLFNLKRVPIGQVDSVGTNKDVEYGIVVVTIQMSKKDTSRIENMHWTMPRGTRTIAVFSSLLAKSVMGMTIEEAANVDFQDVITNFNVNWPTKMEWNSVAPLQALRQALNSIRKL